MAGTFADFYKALCKDGGVKRQGGINTVDLLDWLESREEPLTTFARELGLEPPTMIAAVAYGALGDGLPDACPTLSRGRPRRGASGPLSEPSLADLFPGSTRPVRLALSAGLLQIYDFWEASHQAAQEADDLGESKVSAYWHGIAHRREPDPGNAAYWFRRVGRHPAFGPLAEAATSLLVGHPALAERLLPRGAWDPFAFIDLCSRASGEEAVLARGLQRLEMLSLLDASLPA